MRWKVWDTKTGVATEAPAESSDSVERYERRPGGTRRREIAARRRRRRRQRRMILCGFLLLIVLLIGGIGFGIVNYRNHKAKEALIESGVTAIGQESYEEAIRYFDQAVEKSGGRIGKLETNALLFRAEAEYRQGDYAAALHTYELLLEKDSENTEYQKGAALCLMETGDYVKALGLNVLNGQVYNRMAVEQIAAGQYDEALSSIEQGRICQDDTITRELDYNEAVAWEYKSDFAKALRLFEAYAEKYGADETILREITFLKTRVTDQ